MVDYSDPGAEPEVISLDADGDGTPDLALVDSNADGQADAYATVDEAGNVTTIADTDRSGDFETITQDLGGDGTVDIAQQDQTGDGFHERTTFADGTTIVTDPATGLIVDVQPGGSAQPEAVAGGDGQSVIPAGQPGGPEAVAGGDGQSVIPAGQPGGPEAGAPEAVEGGSLAVVAPDGSRGTLPGLDTDSDGIVDSAELDLVGGDGQPDSLVFDTNRDGIGDTIIADMDLDGIPDRVLQDPTQSGDWQDVTGQAQGTTPAAGDPGAATADPAGGELVLVDASGQRQTIQGVDTDNDGRADGAEVDASGDGVKDTFLLDTDRDGLVDTISNDSDGDGETDKVLRNPTGTGQWQDATAEFTDSEGQPTGTEPAPAPDGSGIGLAPTTVDPTGDPRVATSATGTNSVIGPDGTPGR